MCANNAWYLLACALPFQSVVYCHGGRIGFYQGDIRLLPDDMKALRPTIFPVVPRLLNRMYDKVRWAFEGLLPRQPRLFWFMFRLFKVLGRLGEVLLICPQLQIKQPAFTQKRLSFFLQIFSQANTPLKRWLLNFAAKRKGAEVSRGVIRSDSIWDKIFFSKIQVKIHYGCL